MALRERMIGVALLAALLLVPTQPAAAAMDAATKARIEKLESAVQALTAEIMDLKHSTLNEDKPQAQQTKSNKPAIENAGPSPGDKAMAATAQTAQGAKVTIDNGRPTIASADGKSSAALRGLIQFDNAYYMQDASARNLPAAYGPDLSSGSNFRRVYLGVQGKAFGDWSYNLNFDFGGANGTEASGRIQSAYVQYDGLKPFAFRIGAFPPPAGIEDGTASPDTMFLERNAPSDLQRSIAGGDGRDAVSVLYLGDRLFAALSYTGAKVQDSAVFDEQQALLGRVSDLLYSDSDAHFLVGVNGTYVIEPPDAVANGAPALSGTPGASALHTLTLSDPPELTVDSNGVRLVNTGALPAKHLWQWGVEAAGNWRNLYAQAGYYGFEVQRDDVAFKVFTNSSASHTEIVTPSDDSFNGWYVQGSWVLTGEAKTYIASNGAFGPPKLAQPFALDGSGWGAWELAARYSELDLNDHVNDTANIITNWTGATTRTFTYYNTVRGGEQRIATVGLNWYPNSFVRFALNYQWIDIDRLQAPATVTTSGTPALPMLDAGQTVQAIAFRSQISF